MHVAPSGETPMATMLCVASPTGIMGGCAQSNCFASAFLYQLPNTVLGAFAEDTQHSQHGGCGKMLDDITMERIRLPQTCKGHIARLVINLGACKY